jgi:electron transport complex protein RnfG
MMNGSISRNSILLGLFAVLTTTIIAGTYLGTRERIAEEQRKAAEKALLEIVPLDRHNNAMLDDTVGVGAEDGSLGLRKDADIYIARRDGVPVAVILPAIARDGYSGDIQLIIGINIDGTVAGVRALAHRETPGLGDKVDLKKSPWILGFNGRSLGDPLPEKWAVKKDRGVFDQFTGATITPRAVTAAVKRALEYYAEHRNELLGIEEDNNG